MEVLGINVAGIGPLIEKQCDFVSPGMSLVFGPNESGKSTLSNAINQIIYGFPTRRAAEQSQSWERSERFEGRVEIGIGEDVYTIERDFLTDQTTVTQIRSDLEKQVIFEGNANPRGRSSELPAYRELLRERLCIPPMNVFMNTAHVGQLSVEIQLDDDLRRQISGAGQADYKNAREIMRDQYYELSRNPLPGEYPRRDDRKIEKLKTEIEQLEADLVQAEISSKRMNQLLEMFQTSKLKYEEALEQCGNRGQDIESENFA
jgi:uncharacterized protein YhaN